MNHKKCAVFFLVLSLGMPCLLEAAEKKAAEAKKFQASSLWGVRRGPNAPKPVKAESSERDEAEAARKKSMEAMDIDRAKTAYVNSLSSPARSTKTVSSGSAECAAKPK